MLMSYGFPASFIQLIYECILTPNFSILIDGRPYGFIPSNRGLQQGDPLSPYSFCIAMEYFTLHMEERVINKHLQPISNTQPAITHLLYADDDMKVSHTICNSQLQPQLMTASREISSHIQQVTLDCEGTIDY